MSKYLSITFILELWEDWLMIDSLGIGDLSNYSLYEISETVSSLLSLLLPKWFSIKEQLYLSSVTLDRTSVEEETNWECL